MGVSGDMGVNEEWRRMDNLSLLAGIRVSHERLGSIFGGSSELTAIHSMVPETYIETLNMYLGKKALEYRLRDRSSAPNQQASLDTSQSFSPSEHDSLGKKLAGQQKWARSLARQVDAHKSAGEPSASTSTASLEQSYAVRPPRDGKLLKRQGPYMIVPEPQQLPLSQEAGWGIEGVASDIIVLADQSSMTASQSDKELQGTGMNVVGIAWIDGRIDLCMEAQKVDAEWEADEVSSFPVLSLSCRN